MKAITSKRIGNGFYQVNINNREFVISKTEYSNEWTIVEGGDWWTTLDTKKDCIDWIIEQVK